MLPKFGYGLLYGAGVISLTSIMLSGWGGGGEEGGVCPIDH